jgi:hypothetical protein
MRTRLVFLVPGFFGFTSVGAVSYFEDVEQAARPRATHPGKTGSLQRCR